MNTIGRQDFAEFLKFVSDFSLHDVAADNSKAAEIRKAHAQFFSLLTASAELASDSGSVRQEFMNAYAQPGKDYLGEVVSDCAEFIMCVLLGLFRAAGGTLRSAIESYLKAFSAKEQPLILKRTSVPEVFNDAAGVAFFSSPIGKRVIADLKGIYGDLNSYVHTVSETHMFGANAIGAFPCWSENNVRLVGIFVRVVRLFLYGIVGSRRDLYDRFDHRNKVVANRAMTRSQRRFAMGVDD